MKSESKSAETYYNQGMEKFKLDFKLKLDSTLEDKLKALVNTEEAIKDFNQSIKLGFKNVESYIKLFSAQRFLGDILKTLLLQCADISKENISTDIVLDALRDIRANNIPSFLTQYAEVLQNITTNNSQNAEAYYKQGIIKLFLKQYAQAILNFDKSIDLNHLSATQEFGSFNQQEAKQDIYNKITELFINNKKNESESDLNQAKEFYEQKGNTTAINNIEKILKVLR